MSKFDRVRSSFKRIHNDLFETTRYDAEFFNYQGGGYDPSTGHIDGESRSSLGTLNVEITPPQIDTSVRVGGTSFSWDTTIRFPIGVTELTVDDGETYTVVSGETELYNAVTIADGGTLEVNGSIITKSVDNDGAIIGSGTLSVFGGSGDNPLVTSIRPLGEDAERPTEVEITDQQDNTTELYQLHGYNNELGSGMIMCRLVEA